MLMAVAVLAFGAPPARSATRDAAEVQRWINTQAQRSNSEELAHARSSVVGDLDGDGRNDIAVLYTLRPRNGQRGEHRYLAVFKQQRDGLRYHAHVLVGGSGAVEANRATILNKTVVVEILAHRAGDAACCPTRPATRRYRLAPRGLTLVREPAKSRVGSP